MDILTESRGVEYFTNLHGMIGMSENRWPEVFVKELIDNSLDAVDLLDTKAIDIVCEGGLFAVRDNAGGIPESAFDDIYDFNLHVSSKRHTRTVSRGAQGNALKTVIALCYRLDCGLSFVTCGKRITYTPDPVKIGLGHLVGAFQKTTEDTDQPDGVYVGAEVKNSTLWNYLLPYIYTNPDVKFTVNGQAYVKYSEARKLKGDHSVHWYDGQAFGDLLRRTAINYPDKTIRQFMSQFTGTQRLKVAQPGGLLQDIYTDDDAIQGLLDELKAQTKRPTPKSLEKYSMGKEVAEAIDKKNFEGYRRTFGEYQKGDAVIPYMVEAVLSRDEDDRNEVVTCINNSPNYSPIPFKYSDRDITLAGQEHSTISLSELLRESLFMNALGYSLLIHLVTPHLEYYDKAKSTINADALIGDIIKTINPLLTPVIKEIRRKRREIDAENRPRKPAGERQPSKRTLMSEYFHEGAMAATGDWKYPTTARQVFYAVRRLVNNNYGITLKGDSDYNVFTQDIITEEFEKNPDLESSIFFERRGFYFDIEDGEEHSIDTQRVNGFTSLLDSRRECSVTLLPGVYESSRQDISYPYELAVSSVLFVEKQGYTEAFLRSGLLRDLNMGLISAQGFSTRAMKKLIQYLTSRGISVYALHDCDLAGQIIGDRLTGGSNTFKDELDVQVIGLTYADTKSLGKLPDAEEYTSSKSYENVLAGMTEEERGFFLKSRHGYGYMGKTHYTYRRVELNALTTPELLDYIRSKIPKKEIRPTRDQVRAMVAIDPEELKRDAVTRHLMQQVDVLVAELDIDATIDHDKVTDAVISAMSNGNREQRWEQTFNEVISQHKRVIMETALQAIGRLNVGG